MVFDRFALGFEFIEFLGQALDLLLELRFVLFEHDHFFRFDLVFQRQRREGGTRTIAGSMDRCAANELISPERSPPSRR